MTIKIFYYDWTKDFNIIFQDYKFKSLEYITNTSTTKNELFNFLLEKDESVFGFLNLKDCKFLEIPSLDNFYCNRGGGYLKYFEGQKDGKNLEIINSNTNVLFFYHHSQHNEDSIINSILDKISTNKILVDIGSKDGKYLSNIYLLRQKGYIGYGFDIDLEGGENDDNMTFFKKLVTPDNFVELLNNNNIPYDFDFCNIDIDGNDIHLLDALLKSYKPKLICIEADSRNEKWRKNIHAKYNINYKSKDHLKAQASIIALNNIAESYQYKCVYNNTGNVFFVSDTYINNFSKLSQEEIKTFVVNSLNYYNNDLETMNKSYEYIPGAPYKNREIKYHPRQRLREIIDFFKINLSEIDNINYNYPFIPMYKIFD